MYSAYLSVAVKIFIYVRLSVSVTYKYNIKEFQNCKIYTFRLFRVHKYFVVEQRYKLVSLFST